MPIISFFNDNNEQTGKTMSLVAIATYMAVNYNNRILIISTTNREDKIKTCFFEEKKVKKLKRGIFGENKVSLENESGIEGISKISRSNKLTPEIITNYTRVVFKDRLEILLGVEKTDEVNYSEIVEEYADVINLAKSYYDIVFVDLDNDVGEENKQKIIDNSDLVIVNSTQNYTSLKKIKEKKDNEEILNTINELLLIGRYDKYSKYNFKNITRFLGEKNQVLTMPYNTLFFEAANEAGVPDLFLKLKKLSDYDDRNAIFLEEVKRASENIVYRLQEIEARM